MICLPWAMAPAAAVSLSKWTSQRKHSMLLIIFVLKAQQETLTLHHSLTVIANHSKQQLTQPLKASIKILPQFYILCFYNSIIRDQVLKMCIKKSPENPSEVITCWVHIGKVQVLTVGCACWGVGTPGDSRCGLFCVACKPLITLLTLLWLVISGNQTEFQASAWSLIPGECINF